MGFRCTFTMQKLMGKLDVRCSLVSNLENWVNIFMSRDDRTKMEAFAITIFQFCIVYSNKLHQTYLYCILCFGASNYSSGCNSAVLAATMLLPTHTHKFSLPTTESKYQIMVCTLLG